MARLVSYRAYLQNGNYMELKPKQADPINAIRLLQNIPGRAKTLLDFLGRAIARENRFTFWRRHQLSRFITFVSLYAGDLNETYRSQRIDSMAMAMRNLMELSVWVRFCELSEENGKRFFDDGYRDLRDMLTALQKVYRHVNKQPEARIDGLLDDMKTKAPQFEVLDYDAAYLRVNEAAEKIGKQEMHSGFYKIASKFAHPTALLLTVQEDAVGGMTDSMVEIGAKLADRCLTELDTYIRTIYADLSIK
jgi:hypothetical protein